MVPVRCTIGDALRFYLSFAYSQADFINSRTSRIRESSNPSCMSLAFRFSSLLILRACISHIGSKWSKDEIDQLRNRLDLILGDDGLSTLQHLLPQVTEALKLPSAKGKTGRVPIGSQAMGICFWIWNCAVIYLSFEFFCDIVDCVFMSFGSHVLAASPRVRGVQTPWVFREFLKCLATADHPLVLCFDDIQWADQSSLDLLGSFVNIPNLFIICTYNPTLVSNSVPFSV